MMLTGWKFRVAIAVAVVWSIAWVAVMVLL